MTFEELLEYLDLEDGTDFEYFEAMADLVESEEYIDPDSVFRLFELADNAVTEDLLNDYFEDLLGGLPDDSGEIFSLMHQIKISLKGLIANAEDSTDIRRFSDEFCRFRNWFSHESEVVMTAEDGGETLYSTMRDAVTASRIEKLGGCRYRYDFERALDYELDSYTVPFSELTELEDENEGRIVYYPEDGEPGDEDLGVQHIGIDESESFR